jgi:hypothetical protein
MIRLILGIVVLLCTVSPAFAQGGGREWLEKMSGPELVGTEFRLPVFCTWTAGTPILAFDIPEIVKRVGTADRRLCVDVGYASFNNKDRDVVGELVNMQRFEGAMVYRFDSLARKHPDKWYPGSLMALEPGVAVGVLRFLTDRGAVYRLQVSPRLVIKPIRLIKQARTSRWSNILTVSLRAQWTPKVTNGDIGVVRYQPFRDGWLTGHGVGINLGELLR